MGNIFGIDIGRYSVKLIGLKISLRAVECIVSKEFIFPENTSFLSDANTDSLKKFFAVEGLESADVIVGIPSDIVSVHTISVPFVKDKFIAQAIGPELEEVSPFSLENTIMDYSVVRREHDRTTAITFALHTDTMKQWLDALLRVGLDPTVIDVSHCAYSNLSAYLKLNEPFVVIDIGHAHTSLSFIDNNGLFMARDIKINAPMMGLIYNADAINEAVKSVFIKELKLSINMVERKFNTNINTAVFAGSFSGKANLFEKPLDLQTFSLSLKEIIKEIIGGDCIIESRYALAFAHTLRNIMGKPRNVINLRKGSFAFQHAMEQIKGSLIKTISIAGLLVTVLIVNLAYGYISLNHKKHVMDKKMLQVFSEAFPKEPSFDDPLGTMRYLVSKEKKKAENLSGSIPVTELLREISAGIPKNIEVNVTELSVDPEQITLRGTVPTIDGVDKIVTGIRNFNTIKDVKVIDTRRSTDQKSFEFQLSITLK